LSALTTLKQATTLHDVAGLLGYSPSGLSFILYQIPKGAKYTTFAIPKKGGGTRQIDAPVPHLKVLQRRLADVLYDCLQSIEETAPRKNTLSHAFRRSHSIITNARRHKASRYVLNLDLANFFPTLNFGRIRGFLIKNKHFALKPNVATIIAQIACNDGVLPQGSQCSPVVSELVTHFLDVRLARMASAYRCTYTRYADDITFSTSQTTFPSGLAIETDGSWSLGGELKDRITDAGFEINEHKTRMQIRGSRQSVTGLTVNKKVNVAATYYKYARAMTHSFLQKGQYTIGGVPFTSLEVLEGIVNHIYDVRERQIDVAIHQEKNASKLKKLLVARTKSKNENPSATRVLLHRLVFFKHFLAGAFPLARLSIRR